MMSSSENRIIKYAKITNEPVVIAMQEFRELDIAGLEQFDPDAPSYGEKEEPAEPIAPEDEIILAARAEAKVLIDTAKNEASQLRSQAAEEGRQQGHAAGLQQAKEDGLRQGLEEAGQKTASRLQQAAERSSAIIAAAEQEAAQMLTEAEPKIIELVMAISRKVINDEVAERPAVVLNLVRSALERVRDQEKINIHVSPDDYELILKARRDLQGVVGAERSLTVSADPVQERGGCLIETSFGTVEAGVDTQLEAIKRTLLELLP